MEGSGYGMEQIQYPLIPVATVSNMGRDLLAGTTFQRDLLYWNLYWCTPAPTVIRDDSGAVHYEATPFDDELETTGGEYWDANFMEDWQTYFAQHAALYYHSTPLAQYARQWLSLLSPVAPLGYDPNDTSNNNYYVSNYIISNDPGSSVTSYSVASPRLLGYGPSIWRVENGVGYVFYSSHVLHRNAEWSRLHRRTLPPGLGLIFHVARWSMGDAK